LGVIPDGRANTSRVATQWVRFTPGLDQSLPTNGVAIHEKAFVPGIARLRNHVLGRWCELGANRSRRAWSDCGPVAVQRHAEILSHRAAAADAADSTSAADQPAPNDGRDR